MGSETQNRLVREAAEEFREAGLEASVFAGCSEDQVALLLAFQQDILQNSYNDYVAMIGYSTTSYIFAMEYRKRKLAFSEYVTKNAVVGLGNPVDLATVKIHKNAMAKELHLLNRYFFVTMATREDCDRCSQGGIYNPEACFDRYYSGYGGCASSVLLGLGVLAFYLMLAAIS